MRLHTLIDRARAKPFILGLGGLILLLASLGASLAVALPDTQATVTTGPVGVMLVETPTATPVRTATPTRTPRADDDDEDEDCDGGSPGQDDDRSSDDCSVPNDDDEDEDRGRR